MKKNSLLFLGMAAFTATGISAQTTIFKETFGTTQTTREGCTSGTTSGLYDPQKCERYIDHNWSAESHVWNEGITYTPVSGITTSGCDDSGTTLNIRTNNPSLSSNYSGASGNGNLYFNSNATNSFTISGINTSAYSSVTISFGIFGKSAGDARKIVVQYIDNGGSLTNIAATNIAALNATAKVWELISGVSLPSSGNLTVRFSTPNSGEIRLDDIIITGTVQPTSVNSLNTDKRKLNVSNSTITLTGFLNESVEIFNMQGKKMFTSELKETIQPKLAKGLYIVRIGDFRQKISL